MDRRESISTALGVSTSSKSFDFPLERAIVFTIRSKSLGLLAPDFDILCVNLRIGAALFGVNSRDLWPSVTEPALSAPAL